MITALNMAATRVENEAISTTAFNSEPPAVMPRCSRAVTKGLELVEMIVQGTANTRARVGRIKKTPCPRPYPGLPWGHPWQGSWCPRWLRQKPPVHRQRCR